MSMTSYKYNDKTQLTKNWKATEFKCHGKNHTHDTLINLELVNKVQSFMEHYGLTKGIMSRGYSCKEYNKKIGGASQSKHVTEGAMDVCFYNPNGIVPASQICCWALDYGFNGIAYIDKNYVHLDMRASGKYRGDERKGFSNNVPNGDFYAYFGISKAGNVSRETYQGQLPTLPKRGYFTNGDKGEEVKKLQEFLNWANNDSLAVDGIVGSKTRNSVKSFQTKVGIKADSYFGKDTLAKAKVFSK